MAFACVRVPDPDAAPSCKGDDPGKNCNCSSLTNNDSIRLVAGNVGGLPGGGSTNHCCGGPVAPIDLSTLLADVSFGGLNNGATGPGVRFRWSNGMKSGSNFIEIQNGVGYSWSLNLLGRVLDLGSDLYCAWFEPTNRGEKYYFEKQMDGSFEPVDGMCNVSLEATSTEYWLMIGGTKVICYKTGGGLKKILSAGGDETDFTYDTDDRLEEVRTTRTVGSDYYVNSLVIEYTSGGGGGGPGGPGGPGASTIIETITERSYVGTDSTPDDADFDPMARIELEIPDTAVSGRCPAGYLYRVKFQTPVVSGGSTTWTTNGTKMFIYSTSATTDFYSGAVKYVIDEHGYDSLSNPDTATDGQLKAASSAYYKYEPSTQTVKFVAIDGGELESTITYSLNTGTPTDPLNEWRLKSVYTAPDGTEKTVYSNYSYQDILVLDDDGTDQWIYYTKFDSDGRMIEQYTPAAIDMSGTPYDDSSDDLDVQINSSTGRINTTNWYSTTGSGAAAGYLESRGVKEGSSGTEILISKVEYGSQSVTASSITHTIYPVTKTILYQSDSGGGDPVNTTYSQTWHSGTLMPATVTTNLPDVVAADNGVGYPQSDTVVMDYNTTGQMTKMTDAVGTITEYDHDPATGAVIEVIQDTGVGNLNLTSNSTVNVRGRVTETMGPEHDINGTTVRTVNWSLRISAFEDWTARGYYDVSADTYTLMNPVSINIRSEDRTTVDQITAVRGSTVESPGALVSTDSFPQSSWVSWTQSLADIFGRPTSTRVYHTIPASGSGSSGTNYIETFFGQDEMDRQNYTKSPDGTISRTVFDSRGKPVSMWVGTDDTGATDADPTGGGASGNNMIKLSENEYDGGSEGKNGLLTKVTQMVNATVGDNRETEMEYDWRDRLTNTITSDGTHEFHQKPTLDNLGRATANKTYRDDSGTLKLISQSESFYDDRGRSYRSKSYAVSDAGVAGNSLQSDQWFDANGRVIKSATPGSDVFTKTDFDAVGRATTAYSAYYTGGGTDDPTSVASNVVLTESVTTYDDAGNVTLSTGKDRLHDATGNGALNGPSGSNPKSRDSYAAMWYDGSGRQTSGANYGTNGGTAPTRPTSAPSSSDTVHVNETEYDTAGRVFKTTDAAGDVVKNEYDDAGKTTKVIHNFGGTETQTIRTEYNSSGQMSKQIAENADTGNQETSYSYGVTTASGSDMSSNQLLATMTYPDSGTVTYDYDRTGQQTSMTDPNGTVHDYTYDDAGRRIEDTVSTLGSGVDGAVRRIEHSYDNRRRLEKVTSYDATTMGSVESQTQYSYNDFGQVTKEYQQHGSSVNVSTSPVVEYGHEDGGSNTTRIKSITYPDGRQLDYGYGTSGSQSDIASRIVTIKDGATTLATYEYAGSGMLVTQTQNEPGTSKTLALGSGSNPYSALDRFGRMIDLKWTNSSTDLVSFEYEYDRVSNRLNQRNLVLGSGGSNPAVDSLFEYDELNRLVDYQGGQLNVAGDAITSPVIEQDFTLDETGNFKGFVVKDNGTTTLDQTRTSSTVNEITNITETTGSSWITPAYDTAGSMTTIPKPADLTAGFTGTWDAWNRLVKLEASSQTVATYAYDGNNRRIIKGVYSAGTLASTRHIYYSLQSQALEERVDSGTDAEIQFVWNLGYVDDLLLRDRDTNSNGTLDERLYSLPDLRYCVMALTDSSGSVVERFKYQAYGQSKAMTDLFVDRSSSSYDWEFRYTGRREDLETGLMYFRARYFHASLGLFISRDPLGFVDGMSLYRAYFVPGLVDPEGADATGSDGVSLNFLRGKAAFTNLLFMMNAKCDLCCPPCKENECDVVAPDCCAAMCKADAAKISKHILATWVWNWGKGGNHGRDSVGGYLCWDWARAFLDAANFESTSCWGKHLRGITKPVPKGDRRPMHFFLELNACNKETAACSIAVEDGWSGGNWPGGGFVHPMPWPNSPLWIPTDLDPSDTSEGDLYTKPPMVIK